MEDFSRIMYEHSRHEAAMTLLEWAWRIVSGLLLIYIAWQVRGLRPRRGP